MTPVSRLALSVVFAVLCQLNGRATVTTQLATQPDGVHAAIDRIRNSAHSPLPDLEKRVTAGPVGRGLTIENGTSQTLTAYFKGPILRSLAIPGGSSVDIELTVGEYKSPPKRRRQTCSPSTAS